MNRPHVVSINSRTAPSKGLDSYSTDSKRKPRPVFINQYSRSRFFAALMNTRSLSQAQRMAEVDESHASRFVVEALRAVGVQENGMTYRKAA